MKRPTRKKRFCPKRHDTSKCGRRKGQCIKCNTERSKAYYEKNKKRLKRLKKIYYQKHKKHLDAKKRAWARAHKRKMKLYYNWYWNENKKEIKIKRCKYLKEYYKKNAKRLNRKKRKYRKMNKKKIAAYIRKRLKIDFLFKLKALLRHRLYMALKGNFKSGSAVKDLGCSIEYFKKYIEKKFYGKMTWDNWGKVWELDHIKELWEFDLSDRKQFLIAVNYKNYQPLTIPHHQKKTAKGTKKRRNLWS